MPQLLKPSAAVFSLFIGLALLDMNVPARKPGPGPVAAPSANTTPKIQAAILLDVSNSMDGLIEQAKAQLWNMVSVMGRAKCNEAVPPIEIALYEYGRSSNDQKTGYIKQLSPFTTDLDKLSQDLFKLTTNGGSEYCGHVIYTSLNDLAWDTSSASYKVIFISGNEDFLQGSVSYTRACEEAMKKGVIVNTIYCGSREMGRREHWDLGAECGRGSFTFIDHNAKMEDIATPYDSTLFVLNDRLNATYIGYGSAGSSNIARQQRMDAENMRLNKTAAAKRAAVKGNKQLYQNESWDLVDAVDKDKTFIERVDMKSLPDSLQNKTREQLKAFVVAQTTERTHIQKQMATISAEREKYIIAEKSRAAASNTALTLESEIERIIRVQARRYNMVIQ